jgi:hypothetical protein
MVQSNIIDGDIPIDNTYLSLIIIKPEKFILQVKSINSIFIKSNINPRAPPYFS